MTPKEARKYIIGTKMIKLIEAFEDVVKEKIKEELRKGPIHCSWCNNGEQIITPTQSCPACNRTYKDKEKQ